MATEQEKQMIDQLANQKLGVETQPLKDQLDQKAQQAGDPNVSGQDLTKEASKEPGGPEKATPQEQAAEAVSPKTEGDKQAEDAFIKVTLGEGDERTYSQSQIKDTMKRYRDLNYKHQTQVAPMQPVLDFANAIAAEVAKEDGRGVNANEIVQFLSAASQAYMKNPVMGGQKDPTPDTKGIPLGDIEKDMQQWEEENAMSLPPQYRQAAQKMDQITQENMQIKQLLQNLTKQSQGLQQGAQQNLQTAQQNREVAMKQLAANNLDRAQAKHQLPDSEQDRFFNFAYGRGYTMEDFLDPKLTDTIVGDFKNNLNSPEMARLQEQAKRRQAFTGSLGATPNASGNAPPPDRDQEFIGSVTDNFMKKRNMV